MVNLSRAVVVALLLVSVSASAEDPQDAPGGYAYALANELMSPFCPGRTLADCPSPNAESLRMWIIVQEAAGATRADVEEQLFERYGDVMRPRPRAEGFGLTAYVIPVVAFLIGGGLVALFLSRNTRVPTPDAAPAAAAPADVDLERLVDEELAR